MRPTCCAAEDRLAKMRVRPCAFCACSSVAQWQSIRLLTGGLLVRVQPEEPTSLTNSEALGVGRPQIRLRNYKRNYEQLRGSRNAGPLWSEGQRAKLGHPKT